MAGTNEVTFSAREMEVLALAWQCMETQPKIDMDKLASLTGYTVGSAGVTFGKIKQKIKLLGKSLSADGPAPPKNGPGRAKATPKSTPTKRAAATPKAKCAGAAAAAAAAAAPDTPSKRQKTTRGQPASSSNSADDDDDADEDFGGLGGGAKIKKEEPFDDGLDSPEAEESRRKNYGFLDGIPDFGEGGYRVPFAEDGE